MSPVVCIELEWNYTPVNHLEEPINLLHDGVNLNIQNGKGIAKITPEQFEQNLCLKNDLHLVIEDRLRAAQLFNHNNFELSSPSRTNLRENGTKHHYLQVKPATFTMTTGSCSVDIVVKDKDGNIKSDTKKDRLEKQDYYANILGKHRKTDPTLVKMFDSYKMSVIDSDNEFVYLYEIRDALSARFNNSKTAKKKLCITKDQWNKIGELANDLPLKQGRHRGKMHGSLRNADSSELVQARKAAFNLIDKYIEYIEK